MAKTTGAAAVKHVVLLLMENRPFDHFFGFAQPFLPNKIDGLTGKECFPTRQASAMPTPLATAAPTHPLDGLTKIMYNTFGHEDKFVSFASPQALAWGEPDQSTGFERLTRT